MSDFLTNALINLVIVLGILFTLLGIVIAIRLMREIIRLYKQIVEQFNNAGLVRHGKWTADETLYTHGMAVCSCCKTEYYRDDLYMVGNDAQGELPNYCPNCGADMRGEKQ